MTDADWDELAKRLASEVPLGHELCDALDRLLEEAGEAASRGDYEACDRLLTLAARLSSAFPDAAPEGEATQPEPRPGSCDGPLT